MALSAFVAAILLVLYGAFAILYRGESGSPDTWVSLAGTRIDADVAGAGALVAAVISVGLGVLLLRAGSWRNRDP